MSWYKVDEIIIVTLKMRNKFGALSKYWFSNIAIVILMYFSYFVLHLVIALPTLQ